MKIIVRSKYPNRPINQFTNLPINQTKGGEKKMRHLRIIIAFSVAVFAIITIAFLTNTWARENVRLTKHNLSANTNIVTGTPTTTEVCIYCHTPHGGRTDVGEGAAPIWNRALSNYGVGGTLNFTLYQSPNFDAVLNKHGQPDGVSLACLSCHDGTVAFDALINASGSGGFNLGNMGRGGTSVGHNLNGPFVDTEKSFADGAKPFPNLDIDLSNDHPITMEICSSGKTEYDPQFTEACSNSSESGNILKISRTGDFPTDIRDNIRAYRTKGSTGGWFIECASCHNPHEASSPGDPDGTAAAPGTANSRFLRFPSDTTVVAGTAKTALTDGDRNAGSLLCLSCHQK